QRHHRLPRHLRLHRLQATWPARRPWPPVKRAWQRGRPAAANHQTSGAATPAKASRRAPDRGFSRPGAPEPKERWREPPFLRSPAREAPAAAATRRQPPAGEAAGKNTTATARTEK